MVAEKLNMVAEKLNCVGELPEQLQARASHFYMEYTEEELQSGYNEDLRAPRLQLLLGILHIEMARPCLQLFRELTNTVELRAEVLKTIARHMRVAVERGRPELNKLPKERDAKKKMKAHEKEVMCHDPPPDCHVERHSRSPRFVHCPLLCSDGFGS